MENPNSNIILIEWQWVIIATAIMVGSLHRLESRVHYYQTYRKTGESEPETPTIGIIPIEAVRMFKESDFQKIGAPESIDLYVMYINYTNGRTYTGKIRVDV